MELLQQKASNSDSIKLLTMLLLELAGGKTKKDSLNVELVVST